MLTTALTLNSFAMYAVVIALVPLLITRGAGPSAAAWALGLGGAGQTLGRTLYAALARHTGVTTRTVALIILGGATTAAFAAFSGPFLLLVAVTTAADMVRGNLALLQATAVTDRRGATHYRRLYGLPAAPATIAAALAPFAEAAPGAPQGTYPGLFITPALAANHRTREPSTHRPAARRTPFRPTTSPDTPVRSSTALLALPRRPTGLPTNLAMSAKSARSRPRGHGVTPGLCRPANGRPAVPQTVNPHGYALRGHAALP